MNGHKKYRGNLKKGGKMLFKEAMDVSEGDRLSAKLMLWEAINLCEKSMKKMKNK